ncbi:uncharacterized protein LOC131848355 [Achroia grisella]|uniref:uncharacterized protein LOC131848355 n=1 Tax=Achroia grisella TaxID=688607 RepID=UPI0027D2E7A2|nr:uncharacterized protein LOC131848355 [Achroia grisella]
MDSRNEIKLISLVQQYPCLYDIFDPSYGDAQQKASAWDEIGNSMSSRPRECKMKWTRLRENYRKAMKMRETSKKGSIARPVKYENHLAFLKAFIKTHTTPATAQSDDSSSISGENSSVISNLNESGVSEGRIRRHTSRTQNLIMPSDPIDSFFSAIATTVKTFPKQLQLSVKRQVFDVVSNAEFSLLPSTSKTNITKQSDLTFSNNDELIISTEVKTEINEEP